MVKSSTAGKFSKKRLEKLIEEAIVDCYNESEQAVGLFTAIEENVRLPFHALDSKRDVTVVAFDIEDTRVDAICQSRTARSTVALAKLTLVRPHPPGAEWIAAYCHWARQAGAVPDDEDDEDQS